MRSGFQTLLRRCRQHIAIVRSELVGTASVQFVHRSGTFSMANAINVATKYWTIDPAQIDMTLLKEPADLLARNDVIAFPTETVYGLGGNALSDEAVSKIFSVKGRPSDNPLIVHVWSYAMFESLAEEIPESARKLTEAFWPGPLTVVVKGKRHLSKYCTAGGNTVGIRMPDHPVALALLKMVNIPIAAPSANLSGRPSPTTGQHVRDDLDGKVPGIVDGGPTGIGVESTVVDCSGPDANQVTILRPGGITKADLETVIKRVDVDPALLASDESRELLQPKAPGMKYTHYAPRAPLFIIDGDVEFFSKCVQTAQAKGQTVGAMGSSQLLLQLHERQCKPDLVVECGDRTNLSTVARNLFSALRTFDESPSSVDVIYAESFGSAGIGDAIMNRLRKAAGFKYLRAVPAAAASAATSDRSSTGHSSSSSGNGTSDSSSSHGVAAAGAAAS